MRDYNLKNTYEKFLSPNPNDKNFTHQQIVDNSSGFLT